MLCGMPTVVQHKAPELPASDGSAHGLPLLLKLPVIIRWNDSAVKGMSPVHYTTKRL